MQIIIIIGFRANMKQKIDHIHKKKESRSLLILIFLLQLYQFDMLNKTKNNQGLKRNPSAIANRRPKRCHLCKKNFAFDKYDQHFEACYRFQNKKIEDTKTKFNYKSVQTKNQSSVMPTKYKKNESIKKQTGINPQLQETSNKFRIKNTSNVSQRFKTKNSSIKPQVPNKQNQLRKNEVQIKKQIQRPENLQKKQEVRNVQIVNQPLQIQQAQSINLSQANRNVQPSERRQLVSTPVERESQQLIDLQQVYEPQAQEVIQPPQPQVRQEIQPPRHQASNQRTVVMSSRQIMFAADQRQEMSNEQPYDIQAVINNSNSIIQFIRGMNFMQEDQTLSIMVAQLLQLNQIAQQIAQLNLIGRSLAFRMGNVFAARIHQLQTAIINQIGIALIRGFNDRLGVQFQSLTRMQPELTVGFTQQQIQTLFPQKFNISQKECSICLQDMKRSQMVMQLQCKHIFHPACIKQWLISSKKCPMCRSLQQNH